MTFEEIPIAVPFLKRKGIYLWALAGVGSFHGALYSYGLSHPPSQMGLELFIGFTFNLALLGWCFADAEERKIPITRFLGLALLMVAVVGVPWYFIRSRGFLAALKAVFGFGLIFLWCACMEVTFVAFEAATGHLGS